VIPAVIALFLLGVERMRRMMLMLKGCLFKNNHSSPKIKNHIT